RYHSRLPVLALISLVFLLLFFFFFSSRRRHTRFKCDWSSDVCSSDLNLNLSGGMATGALIDAYPSATVFADGDLPHNNGTDSDYAMAYAPAWGRFRGRTIPVIGNHDYYALNAAGIFSYFGTALLGDPAKGYYS